MNDQAQKLRELVRTHDSSRLQISTNLTPAPHSSSLCKSIAVTSGKGGVGKTNIALFLAITLAAARKKVLLVDADLGLANVHILLGVAPKHNISHFIEGTCTLDQVVFSGSGGIDILPGASGLEKMANLDQGRLEFFQHEFMRLENRYDFLIVDTGAGIGSTVTEFASRTDMTLLVMTPEPTSLADAYAMVKVLYEKGTSRIGTVVNMAASDRDGIETFDRLNALVIKFLKKPLEMLGTIPMNREISRYIRKQRIMILEKTHDQFSIRIQGVARKMIGLPIMQRQGFFGKLWCSRKVL